MTVHEVWNLMQFLNQCQIGFDGDQIILTSEKWLRDEITLDCEKNGKGRLVWHMAIDPMPYDEDTMSPWMGVKEVKAHRANAADDWDPGKDVLISLITEIYKKLPSLREVIENKTDELLAKGANDENDQTDGDKEVQAD